MPSAGWTARSEMPARMKTSPEKPNDMPRSGGALKSLRPDQAIARNRKPATLRPWDEALGIGQRKGVARRG